MAEEDSTPDFEIDQPEAFAQFLLVNPPEILFYLNLLARRRCLFTAYIDDGRRFFLTSIVAVDEAAGQFFLDPSNLGESQVDPAAARQITLLTNLDRVKIQLRLSALRPASYHGQPVLAAALPTRLLRLQRREFFRLESAAETPIICQVAATAGDGQLHTLDLNLSDISGGGACLITAPENAGLFPRGALFQHCRLEIPDEGVIQVNLRVCKAFDFSTQDGQRHLRIGCEFINLSGARQTFIERYIVRIERERKVKASTSDL
ncbi:MAG: flagellar brake protein [Azonexus sp.]|jgi:c-di-GMP-binding flagellar brake protein YcgR|uniref:flagellar brake protein n=1 Tax=Azonexus sp. TaxID=1872668 RepID=UPI0028258401|nr:flagellar brake protein [Azonexus sp.]MDR0777720.1 flagellar brake protein [Azonexus sp.]